MSYINIPRDRDDPNYRYKMPKLISKIEGRGNGIRTNIANMGDIARSLKRPPMYPTKFFGCELGAMVKFEENEEKAIVNGAHKEKDLVSILDKFIEMYVLCPHCLLPETDIIVKKGFLICKCNACGNVGELNNSHKIATYMIKNPPLMSTVGNKKKKSKDKEKEKEKGDKEKKVDKNEKYKNEDNKNGVNHGDSNCNDTSNNIGGECSEEADVDKNTKKEKKGKKKDKKKKLEENFVLEKEALNFESPEINEVIKRLKHLFTSGSRMSENMFAEELRVLQVSQSFDSKCRIFICFCVLFDDTITKEELEKNIMYLKKVNDTSVTVDDIFVALEFYINKVASKSINIYPYILQILYNNDILESKDVIKRYEISEESAEKGNVCNEKKNGAVDSTNAISEEYFEKCRNLAKHFVTWLKENDSDSESDDDDTSINNKVNPNYKVKSLRPNEDNKDAKENGNAAAEEKPFEDTKSEKCDDEIFLDAKDGINNTEDENEEEIDIDAI